jgi:hypothetical protein
MSRLVSMPSIILPKHQLALFGEKWIERGGSLSRTPPQSSLQFGNLFDGLVGNALATMLGNVPIVRPHARALTPSQPNCVEVGPVRIVGSVRPQNFDVGYRPDGVRFAFDSKTALLHKSDKCCNQYGY